MTIRIGVVGLGKLGTPVATCLAKVFPVIGYDMNPELRKRQLWAHQEAGPDGEGFFQSHYEEAIDSGRLKFADSMLELAENSDLIFVAVQTPHQPEFEGSTVLPVGRRADFDYTYLRNACKGLSGCVKPEQTVVIISTVLPGTTRREIAPILRGCCNLVYSPLFIAMSTVMKDFYDPEFVLIGLPDTKDISKFKDNLLTRVYETFYNTVGRKVGRNQLNPPFLPMSYESAEMVKVSYNLMISSKIAFINSIMELSHKTPHCDIDDVSWALQHANKRVASPAYLNGGLPDAGGCHPRDAIAMSWWAGEHHTRFNLFEQIAQSRQHQAEWLVGLYVAETKYKEHVTDPTRRFVLLGKAFKPETSMTVGSSALLCADILKRRWGIEFAHLDPHVDLFGNWNNDWRGQPPAGFLILTAHETFNDMKFPSGSVVVDPFRYLDLSGQEGVKYIPVGIGNSF